MTIYKFRYLLTAATLVCGIISCTGVSKPQAVAMNYMMVQINDSLYYKGKEFGTLIGDAVTTKNFSSLTPVRQNFEQFIDSTRQRLLNMRDVYGSQELRKSEIALLDVEKHMVTNDFAPFEHLTSFSGMQDISVLFDKIKEDSKAETDKMSNFRRAQQAYAKRNGFELQPNNAVR